MSDRNLPDIRPGKSLLGIPASEWQTLIRDVRALRNLSAGPGIKVIKNDAGYVISALPQANGGGAAADVAVAIKTVLIMGEISDDATGITVQEIAYKDDPPEPPTSITPGMTPDYYKTVGEEFKAYPYLGKRAADYSAFVSRSSDAIYPFDVRLIATDTWMLERPAAASGVRIAKVKMIGDTPLQDPNFVRVQPIKTTFANDGTRVEQNDGPEEIVLTWPMLNRLDWQALDTFPILLVASGGNWFATQTVPWDLAEPFPEEAIAPDACPR